MWSTGGITAAEERRNSKRNLFQCHLVYHESDTKYVRAWSQGSAVTSHSPTASDCH